MNRYKKKKANPTLHVSFHASLHPTRFSSYIVQSTPSGLGESTLGLHLQNLSPHGSRPRRDEEDQCYANRQTHTQEHDVHRHGISLEYLVEEIVQSRLAEIEQTAQADDGAIHRSERAEPKHLGRVVRHSCVVERTVEHEQADAEVRSPRSGDDSKDTDRCGTGDEHGKDTRGRVVVKEDADKGDGDDTAEGKGNVEKVVDLDGLVDRAEDSLVLGANGGDKVVDAGHLDHCTG